MEKAPKPYLQDIHLVDLTDDVIHYYNYELKKLTDAGLFELDKTYSSWQKWLITREMELERKQKQKKEGWGGRIVGFLTGRKPSADREFEQVPSRHSDTERENIEGNRQKPGSVEKHPGHAVQQQKSYDRDTVSSAAKATNGNTRTTSGHVKSQESNATLVSSRSTALYYFSSNNWHS